MALKCIFISLLCCILLHVCPVAAQEQEPAPPQPASTEQAAPANPPGNDPAPAESTGPSDSAPADAPQGNEASPPGDTGGGSASPSPKPKMTPVPAALPSAGDEVEPIKTPPPAAVEETPAEEPPPPAPAEEPPAEEPPPAPVEEPPAVAPVVEPTGEAPAEVAPSEAVDEESEKEAEASDDAGILVDTEFDILPPPTEDASAQSQVEESAKWKPMVEWGGEARTRFAQDIHNEISRVEDKPGKSYTKKGTEDVIDWRNSFSFWAKIKLDENIQAFMEVYAEHFTVAKRNEEDPTVLFNGSRARHEFRFEAREIYFDFFFGPFDLRAGNQIVSWGTLAVMSPSNRVNFQDPGAFYWADISGNRTPITALRGIYHAWDLSFEALWIPFFTPPNLDLYGGDYSLIRYGSIYGLTVDRSKFPIPAIDQFISPSKTAAYHPESVMTNKPDANPVNSQAGFRISGTKAGFDFGISYLYGYEEMPTIKMDKDIRGLLKSGINGNLSAELGSCLSDCTGDITQILGNGASLDSYCRIEDMDCRIARIITRLENGESLENMVSSEYERKHSLAAEFGATVWELGIKAEMAFLPDKMYYTTILESVNHDTLSYAMGIDVMKSDLGHLSTLFIDMEIFGSAIFGLRKGEQLIFQTDRNLGLHTSLRLSFLDDDLEFEGTGQVHFSTRDFVLIPRVSYRPIENMRITLGAMIFESWITEPELYPYTTNTDQKRSLFGQFSNNDQIFAMLRYNF